MDALNIISWNVQGLGGSRFRRMRGVFRQELKKPYVVLIDVLMIQTHHLGEQHLLRYGNLLPGRWQHFWLPAFGPNDTLGGFMYCGFTYMGFTCKYLKVIIK